MQLIKQKSSRVMILDPVEDNKKYLLMSWRHDFPLRWQNYISGGTNSADEPDNDWISDRIPYKYRLKGKVGNGLYLSESVILTYDAEGQIESSPLDYNAISVGTNNNLQIGSPGAEKEIEDIWLVYEMS